MRCSSTLPFGWLSMNFATIRSDTRASLARRFKAFASPAPASPASIAVTTSLRRSTFSSAAVILPMASALACSSWVWWPKDVSCFLYLATSFWAALILALYLMSCALASALASRPRASICRSWTNCRAPASAAEAASSAAATCSRALCSSSSSRLALGPSSRQAPTTANALVTSSARATCDSASRMSAVFFLEVVLVLSSLRRLACASSCC
mmetsp:Transcript_6434/g.15863  ORF Transcript_6434/g.15863 Transcript_6434/m.15863 type:complete len:211 (-) Transcript_6434:593-1225(-)